MTLSLPTHPRWWQWPTVLSLDAPVVCLVWQALIARSAGATLAWPHGVVLAASVWLAYAADRWLEGWRVDQRVVRTTRHLFYQRRRWSVAAAWLAVLAADLVVATMNLAPREIGRGALLVVPVLAYLLSHQTLHRASRWRAPKELLVAGLLAAGVAVFAWPVSSGPTLWTGLAIFAVLSFVNCALISSWERDVDRAHGQTSLALDSPRAARIIRWLPWASALAGGLLIVSLNGHATDAVGCGVASAVLLGMLDRGEHRLGWALARVLADAALLTPLVPLMWTI